MVITLLVFLVAAGLAFALTPLVRTLSVRVGAVDAPGGRKIHTRSTPRLGGVAVVLAGSSALAMAAAIDRSAVVPVSGGAGVAVILGALLIFAAGVLDDVRGVKAIVKLAAIAGAALLVTAAGILIHHLTLFGHTYELGWMAWPITFAWIVIVTNAFNLIDGLDGLATGLAIIAAATCAIVLLARRDLPNAQVLVALVGAGVGFLPYNFNPATIFLGDCGSLIFGFVLAVTAITGWQKGATALAVGVPILVLALPIADVAGSIARRVAGNRPVLAADQQHIHHWLLRQGLSHRAAVLLLYALALVLAALAVLTADLH